MPTFPKLILRQEWLGIGLAMIAAYVDGFGLLTFRTYLSFMSGNTTQTGSGFGRGEFALVVPSAVAILFFVAGVVAGNLLRLAVRRDSRDLAFAGIGGLLLLVVCDLQLGWFSDSVRIAVLSLGMGVMNTTLSTVGNEQVNVAFVTGTLNRFAKHVALAVMRAPLEDSQGPWDTQLRRAFLQAWVWTGFLDGAVLGGIATPRLAGWTLLPPAVVLFISAFFARTQSNHSGSRAGGTHVVRSVPASLPVSS